MGPAFWFGVMLGTVVSCVLAKAAGRGAASAWWGLLGPFGWLIAAIHSTADAPAAPPRASRRRAAEPGMLQCVGCSKPIQRGRVTCFHCGAAQE